MAAEVCPECGLTLFALKAHIGKRPCQAAKTARDMEQQGYARWSDVQIAAQKIWGVYSHMVPVRFQRFIRNAKSWYPTNGSSALVEENWLPKWVCAVILAGSWTTESIEHVEKNKDLQAAYALEFDIRCQSP